MEWISVKDRLPENRIIEVICVRKTKTDSYYSIPLTWRGDGFYFFLDKYNLISDITHWMPLPEPPKTHDQPN